jgi:hypothetical protein
MTEQDKARIRADFAAVCTIGADELEAWLETDESRKVGFVRAGESESVGHAAGRRIVAILRRAEADLDDDDYLLMRKAVGYVRRHRAQEPANPVTSRWRYALMNWGHDPLDG